MDQLVTCRACSVHVRSRETVCPFCGAASPSSSLENGLRARTSRAALHRLHAAAMATCAIACDRAPSTSTVTITPTASSVPDVASPAASASADTTATATASETATASATATATATATAKIVKRAAGATCSSSGDCAAGLSCCITGMRGGCRPPRGWQGDNPPKQEPCIMIETCVAGPCSPMPQPPYGGAFPDDGSTTV